MSASEQAEKEGKGNSEVQSSGKGLGWYLTQELPSPRRMKETHGMTLMFLTLVFLWLRMVLHLGKIPVVPT